VFANQDSGGALGALGDVPDAGVLVLDHEGRIADVNPLLCRMLDREQGAFVGRRYEELFAPDATPDLRRPGAPEALQRALMLGAAQPTVDVAVRPVLAGGRAGTLLVVRPALEARPTGVEPESHETTARIAAERDAARAASERARARQLEAEALSRVALAAAGASDVRAVAQVIAREVADLLDTDGAIVVRTEGRSWKVLGRAGNVRGARVGDQLGHGDDPALTLALRTGEPAWGTHSRLAPAAEGRLGGGSSVAAPMVSDGDALGAIVVVRADGTTPQDTIERLDRFAARASDTVAAADARSRLVHEAASDALTGLLNQKTFHRRLADEVARARRYGRPLALVLFDIDHFKELNDRFGHAEGDRAIRAVSACLSSVARSADEIARVGGEEFAWILPETDGQRALEAAGRARVLVSDVRTPAGEHLRVSAGICDASRADDPDELFRLADTALYWAKANGRDQACLFSPEVAAALPPEERAWQLSRARRLGVLRSLVRSVDARRPGVWGHSERVADMASRIAGALGWSEARAAHLAEAGLLHDIGKIAVPDDILAREPSLGQTELVLLQRHPTVGAEVAREALADEQCSWIRSHHERWDGRGFPEGLAGEAIPDGARIIAVADTWDRLAGRRSVTGTARPVGLGYVRALAGVRLCPESVRALTEVLGAGADGPEPSRGGPAD